MAKATNKPTKEPKVRTKICRECPFQRKSLPGWLGSNDPETFAAIAMSDSSIACHTSMDQTLPRSKWLEKEAEAPRCRGALTMMKNKCQVPRDPKMAELVRLVPADRVSVFSNQIEFINYHNESSVKSWEV